MTRGVVGSPVTDLATAAALGSAVNGGSSTGHAHIAREEAPSPVAANVVMRTGSATEAELIADVERGIYVEGSGTPGWWTGRGRPSPASAATRAS